jgi:hypothetical protein
MPSISLDMVAYARREAGTRRHVEDARGGNVCETMPSARDRVAFWSDVNVNAVHPGLTRTEATPGVVAAQAAAAVIVFLASPLSVSINGESIACGGGTPGVIRY